MKNGRKHTKLISTLLLCCILTLGALVPIFSLTASAYGYNDAEIIYTAEGTDEGSEPAPADSAPAGSETPASDDERNYDAENAPYYEIIKPLVIVGVGAILAIVVISLVISMLRRHSRLSRDFYEDREETIELYDDFEKIEWDEELTVTVPGDEPEVIELDSDPIMQNMLMVDEEKQDAIHYDKGSIIDYRKILSGTPKEENGRIAPAEVFDPNAVNYVQSANVMVSHIHESAVDNGTVNLKKLIVTDAPRQNADDQVAVVKTVRDGESTTIRVAPILTIDNSAVATRAAEQGQKPVVNNLDPVITSRTADIPRADRFSDNIAEIKPVEDAPEAEVGVDEELRHIYAKNLNPIVSNDDVEVPPSIKIIDLLSPTRRPVAEDVSRHILATEQETPEFEYITPIEVAKHAPVSQTAEETEEKATKNAKTETGSIAATEELRTTEELRRIISNNLSPVRTRSAVAVDDSLGFVDNVNPEQKLSQKVAEETPTAETNTVFVAAAVAEKAEQSARTIISDNLRPVITDSSVVVPAVELTDNIAPVEKTVAEEKPVEEIKETAFEAVVTETAVAEAPETEDSNIFATVAAPKENVTARDINAKNLDPVRVNSGIAVPAVDFTDKITPSEMYAQEYAEEQAISASRSSTPVDQYIISDTIDEFVEDDEPRTVVVKPATPIVLSSYDDLGEVEVTEYTDDAKIVSKITTISETVEADGEEILREIKARSLDPIKARSNIVIPAALDFSDNTIPAEEIKETATEAMVIEAVATEAVVTEAPAAETNNVFVATAVAEKEEQSARRIVSENLRPIITDSNVVIPEVELTDNTAPVEEIVAEEKPVEEIKETVAEVVAAEAVVTEAPVAETNNVIVAAAIAEDEEVARTIISDNLRPIITDSGVVVPAVELTDNIAPVEEAVAEEKPVEEIKETVAEAVATEAVVTEAPVAETNNVFVAAVAEENAEFARTITVNNLDPISLGSEFLIPDTIDFSDNTGILDAEYEEIAEAETEKSVFNYVVENGEPFDAATVIATEETPVRTIISDNLNPVVIGRSIAVPNVEFSDSIVTDEIKVESFDVVEEQVTAEVVEETAVPTEEIATEEAVVTEAVAEETSADETADVFVAAAVAEESEPARTIISENLRPIITDSNVVIPAVELTDNTAPVDEVVVEEETADEVVEETVTTEEIESEEETATEAVAKEAPVDESADVFVAATIAEESEPARRIISENLRPIITDSSVVIPAVELTDNTAPVEEAVAEEETTAEAVEETAVATEDIATEEAVVTEAVAEEVPVDESADVFVAAAVAEESEPARRIVSENLRPIITDSNVVIPAVELTDNTAPIEEVVVEEETTTEAVEETAVTSEEIATEEAVVTEAVAEETSVDESADVFVAAAIAEESEPARTIISENLRPIITDSNVVIPAVELTDNTAPIEEVVAEEETTAEAVEETAVAVEETATEEVEETSETEETSVDESADVFVAATIAEESEPARTIISENLRPIITDSGVVIPAVELTDNTAPIEEVVVEEETTAEAVEETAVATEDIATEEAVVTEAVAEEVPVDESADVFVAAAIAEESEPARIIVSENLRPIITDSNVVIPAVELTDNTAPIEEAVAEEETTDEAVEEIVAAEEIATEEASVDEANDVIVAAAIAEESEPSRTIISENLRPIITDSNVVIPAVELTDNTAPVEEVVVEEETTTEAVEEIVATEEIATEEAVVTEAVAEETSVDESADVFVAAAIAEDEEVARTIVSENLRPIITDSNVVIPAVELTDNIAPIEETVAEEKPVEEIKETVAEAVVAETVPTEAVVTEAPAAETNNVFVAASIASDDESEPARTIVSENLRPIITDSNVVIPSVELTDNTAPIEEAVVEEETTAEAVEEIVAVEETATEEVEETSETEETSVDESAGVFVAAAVAEESEPARTIISENLKPIVMSSNVAVPEIDFADSVALYEEEDEDYEGYEDDKENVEELTKDKVEETESKTENVENIEDKINKDAVEEDKSEVEKAGDNEEEKDKSGIIIPVIAEPTSDETDGTVDFEGAEIGEESEIQPVVVDLNTKDPEKNIIIPVIPEQQFADPDMKPARVYDVVIPEVPEQQFADPDMKPARVYDVVIPEIPEQQFSDPDMKPVTLEDAIVKAMGDQIEDNSASEEAVPADVAESGEEELKTLTASEILAVDSAEETEEKIIEEPVEDLPIIRTGDSTLTYYSALDDDDNISSDVEDEFEEEHETYAERVRESRRERREMKRAEIEMIKQRAADEMVFVNSDEDFDTVEAARERHARANRDAYDNIIINYGTDIDLLNRRTAPIEDEVEILTSDDISATDDRILSRMDMEDLFEEQEAENADRRRDDMIDALYDEIMPYRSKDGTHREVDAETREAIEDVIDGSDGYFVSDDETDPNADSENDNPYGIVIPSALKTQSQGLREATLAATTPFNVHSNKDLTRDALWLMALEGSNNMDDSITSFIDMNDSDDPADAILLENQNKARDFDLDAFVAGRFTPEDDDAPAKKITIEDLLAPTPPARNMKAQSSGFDGADDSSDDPALPDLADLAREFARSSMRPKTFSDGGVSVNDESGKLARFDMSQKRVDIGNKLTVDGMDMNVLSAYDISFADASGNAPEYSDNDCFEVALPAPTASADADINAVYYDESGEGKHEMLPTEVVRGADGRPKSVKFLTTHFSVFALVSAPTEYDEQSYPAAEIVAEVHPSDDPAVAAVSEETDNDATMLVNGELVLVHYRSSYMSRLIQSDEQLKDCYSVIKNALLSFEGVKSRISWSGESFNKGRINCAKVNVKGRSLTVALALDPADYEGTKYYFKDVSDKPKYDKVPMLIKVRSERSLKYALELIEDMMSKLGIEFESESLVDYTMPYESTESLVARELIKVILPSGMTLDDNANIVKMDVAKLIEDSKDTDDESDDFDTEE